MSAPRTDIDKQKRRHLTPLIGIILAVAFGFFIIFLWVFDEFESAEPTEVSNGDEQEIVPEGSEIVEEVEAGETERTVTPETDAATGQDGGENAVTD